MKPDDKIEFYWKFDYDIFIWSFTHNGRGEQCRHLNDNEQLAPKISPS